jgi:hypothetical protein
VYLAQVLMILMLKKMQAGRDIPRRALDSKPLPSGLHRSYGTGYPRRHGRFLILPATSKA